MKVNCCFLLPAHLLRKFWGKFSQNYIDNGFLIFYKTESFVAAQIKGLVLKLCRATLSSDDDSGVAEEPN